MYHNKFHFLNCSKFSDTLQYFLLSKHVFCITMLNLLYFCAIFCIICRKNSIYSIELSNCFCYNIEAGNKYHDLWGSIMVFSSIIFIFVFLPVFLALYYIVPAKFRNFLLFLGSLIFYSFGDPSYLFLILCSITVNFLLGRGMERFEGRDMERTLLLVLSLFYNLGLLLFFKYTNFFY